MKNLVLGLGLMATLFSSGIALAEDEVIDNWRMYRLNCGEVHVKDLNVFSDTDQYVGQEGDLVVSCYLFRKGKTVFLWDTGLPSAIAKNPEQFEDLVFAPKIERTLTEQLADLNLKPEDVTEVAISHGHFDHAGNVNLFKNAMLIMQESEFHLLKNDPDMAKEYHMNPDLLSHFLGKDEINQVRTLNGDADLFGDGALKAISLPGHTPGHMALRVQLENSGVYILSGDQWHFDENHEANGVPSFNYDRADTLASSDRLDKLVKNSGATLVLQHEFDDVSVLPKFPLYLD